MLDPQELTDLDKKSYQIYALIDPRDSLVYYVGLSIDAQARFNNHLSRGSEREITWIEGLKQEGKSPILYILENIEAAYGAYARACELELYWIQELARSGNPLLNKIGLSRTYIPPPMRGSRSTEPIIADIKRHPYTPKRKVLQSGSTEQKSSSVSSRFLTVEDIAKDLGVTEETIRTYIRAKKLIAYRVGRDYKILKEDYDRFLEERRTTRDTDTEDTRD